MASPSQVSGGRSGSSVETIVFSEDTLLGESSGQIIDRLIVLKEAFGCSSLRIRFQADITDWIRVHYLQQSVNAGAILEVGTYDRFAHSPKRIGRMIKAYRKRVQICASLGLILKISFLRHCLYFLFPSSPWPCRKCLKIRTLKT